MGWANSSILHTRGHANHHFCVVDDRTSSVFTGDAFGLVYPDLQDAGLWALPSTSPTDFDASEAKASLDRIVGTGAGTAYLTHFGGHKPLQEIADQLHRQLDDYGAIVDDAMSSGVDGDELDAMCRRRVEAIFEPYLTTARRRDAVQTGAECSRWMWTSMPRALRSRSASVATKPPRVERLSRGTRGIGLARP